VFAITDAATRRGLQTARNAPYAGAHTIARHADPGQGLHAVQVETDRRLYLDAELREPGAGLEATAALFGSLCAAGLTALDGLSHRLAAE
jgi:N-formylglutamate amidohydrolase